MASRSLPTFLVWCRIITWLEETRTRPFGGFSRLIEPTQQSWICSRILQGIRMTKSSNLKNGLAEGTRSLVALKQRLLAMESSVLSLVFVFLCRLVEINVNTLCAGFVRFLGPYYMLVIKRRKKVGEICGHAVYGIAETEQIMIPYPSPETRVANSLAERRYLIDRSCNGFVYSYEKKKNYIVWT